TLSRPGRQLFREPLVSTNVDVRKGPSGPTGCEKHFCGASACNNQPTDLPLHWIRRIHDSDDSSSVTHLQNVMLVQNLDKIANVGANRLDVGRKHTADLLGDLCLVESPLEQLDNLRADHIQTKHLAMVDVEQNSPIFCLCSPDGVRNSKHRCRTSRSRKNAYDQPAGALWHPAARNSSNV